MKVISQNLAQPELSIVLLDWSCRESFHSLNYLAKQDVPRSMYEVIWVEYYDTRAPELDRMLGENTERGEPQSVDTWIVMDVPRNVCYHKHFLYNVGLVASRGKVVCFCDSDAMFTPTFVSSILNAFAANPNIVLHLDEVRNIDRSHYPFDNPSFEQLLDQDCINWKDGKTTGLWDTSDPIHSLNYGACMCALREDLIAIGGADEHIDYLGHVCGPYDMTFRLVNNGKKEIWHEEEFLFHTWHPGSDGIDNYIGPHDGRNVSTRAIEAIQSKRIMPDLENDTVRLLRVQGNSSMSLEGLLEKMRYDAPLDSWVLDKCKLAISLGRSAFYRNDFDEALRQWQAVEEALLDDATLQGEIGWAHYFCDENDTAMAAFNKSLLLDPTNQLALRGRGWLHNRLGNFQGAVVDFTAVLPLLLESCKDHKQEAFRGRGFSYYHLGCQDEAIADLQQAIALTAPECRQVLHELYHTLGHAYVRKAETLRREVVDVLHAPCESDSEPCSSSNLLRLAAFSLKDFVKSNTHLYLLARHGQGLVRRMIRKLKSI